MLFIMNIRATLQVLWFPEVALMLTQSSASKLQLEKLKAHLKTERYCPPVQQLYPALAGRFLQYLERQAISIGAVSQSDVDSFLRLQHRKCCKRHEKAPPFRKWRRPYTAAVNMLLRMVYGRWPVPPEPVTAIEIFHKEILQDYDAWLRDLRGLQPITRAKRAKHARQFLAALGPRGSKNGLMRIGAAEIDAYVEKRCAGFARQSIEDCTVCLRDFLRHLHRTQRTALNLGRAVIGPRIYDYEHIPSAMKSEYVEKILKFTSQDRSSRGLRDYALLILLAVYGLRAAEIIRLRLEDIDWRYEILRVRHSKTGTSSELPLLPEAGEAVLQYLQNVRPKSTHREVFLYTRAPYRPYATGAVLNSVINARLRALEIRPESRKGAHAFRHALAVSLLRTAVPFKIIGDILGHTSARSTAVYLKLATDDLRTVGLELPRSVGL